jgi:hypothetical protein
MTSSSPISYSPVLRRLRSNTLGRGGLRSPGDESSAEDESRWRPRSFDSFFQESEQVPTVLLEDFANLDIPPPASNPVSASSPYPTRPSRLGSTVSDEDLRSNADGANWGAPKLAPRQLFDSSATERCKPGSGSNSDDNDTGANSFPSHVNHARSLQAYTNAYASSLSFSGMSVPVRDRSRSHTAREELRTTSPPLPTSLDLAFIPLAKSYSESEIGSPHFHERGSTQSPLRLMAARKQMETPSKASQLSHSPSESLDPDCDSEKGSDYDSEEDGIERKRKGSGGSGGILRRRVIWQRARSPSLEGKRVVPPSTAWMTSSLWLCIILLAAEVAGMFYLGYTYRAAYSAISLHEFGGFWECTLPPILISASSQ